VFDFGWLLFVGLGGLQSTILKSSWACMPNLDLWPTYTEWTRALRRVGGSGGWLASSKLKSGSMSAIWALIAL
jgi:hypothetical protein